MLKVKNNPDLRRDPYSHAIINTNENEYKKAVLASQRANEMKNRIATIESDLDNVKSDISQIKEMLSKFMEKY